MEVIRCSGCNKKLAEADYRHLSIKCPRCGMLNTLKAIEPRDSAPDAQKARPDGRVP